MIQSGIEIYLFYLNKYHIYDFFLSAKDTLKAVPIKRGSIPVQVSSSAPLGFYSNLFNRRGTEYTELRD